MTLKEMILTTDNELFEFEFEADYDEKVINSLIFELSLHLRTEFKEVWEYLEVIPDIAFNAKENIVCIAYRRKKESE